MKKKMIFLLSYNLMVRGKQAKVELAINASEKLELSSSGDEADEREESEHLRRREERWEVERRGG